MPKKKQKHSVAKALGAILLGITAFTLLVRELLEDHNIALFNPQGLIAQEQLNLGLLAAGMLLLVAVPTIFALYFTAWKYRESNTKATHDPEARHGRGLNMAIWIIPCVFAVVLASIMWPATHRLEPKKTVAAEAKPLTIQVVAMRWKWLFIYPEQNIATVNYVQIPVNTPVQFELTADEAPMSSFWIPNLGGMLYAMTGHNNRLNLMAHNTGEYPGSTAEINGPGFSGMRFTAQAATQQDFADWVEETRQYTAVLDATAYGELLKPSENHLPAFYSAADRGLYDTVLMKYNGAHGGHRQAVPEAYEGGH